jgi:hypothetical protein
VTNRLRGPLWLLALAVAAAAPWWLCRMAAWDADLSVLSGGRMTEQMAFHALFSLVSWLLASLVSPSLAVAAGWRGILELIPLRQGNQHALSTNAGNPPRTGI